MSYLLVHGQQSMTLDSRRNEAYRRALETVITPESVVLDLGAGLGIHGLIAAQLGAKRVYLVEPEDIIAVAEEIARANGLSDRVCCLQGKIEEIDLPEPVDVIVSVFTGNFLLEEDLLPSLFYARDKYLKPGGVLIPEAGVMEAVPISVPQLYQEEIEIWSQRHQGIDYGPARPYTSHAVHYCRSELANAVYLAAPASLMALNFYQSSSTACKVEAAYSVQKSDLCHGWAGWFKMKLGENWLSTAPHYPSLHWSAAFLPLDPPLLLTAGEEVIFQLQRPPYGDWNWRVQTTQAHQQHSTFFSVPMSLNTLRKAGSEYQPQLTHKGKAATYVLSQYDGTQSVQEISKQLFTEFPEVFTDYQQAFRFVQRLAASYS